jgi:hypothetical protein
MPTKDEHFGNGLGLYGKNDYEGALVELGKAVALDPRSPTHILAMGHSLHKLKRLPRPWRPSRRPSRSIRMNRCTTSLSTVFRDMGMIPEAEEEMAVSFQLQRGY